MFKRRRRAQSANSQGSEVFERLRGQVLRLDPADAGMPPTPGSPRIWGGMMEMGYPKGAATLVCLRDGTTSLYTSSGGGIIGGGEHAPVVSANAVFLAGLAAHLVTMRPNTDESLPTAGRVVFRVLTYDGPLTSEAASDDLGYGRSLLSPVFYAAHQVITELRLISEQESAGR